MDPAISLYNTRRDWHGRLLKIIASLLLKTVTLSVSAAGMKQYLFTIWWRHIGLSLKATRILVGRNPDLIFHQPTSCKLAQMVKLRSHEWISIIFLRECSLHKCFYCSEVDPAVIFWWIVITWETLIAWERFYNDFLFLVWCKIRQNKS